MLSHVKVIFFNIQIYIYVCIYAYVQYTNKGLSVMQLTGTVYTSHNVIGVSIYWTTCLISDCLYSLQLHSFGAFSKSSQTGAGAVVDFSLHRRLKTNSWRQPIIAVSQIRGQNELWQLCSLRRGRFEVAATSFTVRWWGVGGRMLRLGFFNVRLWRVGCLEMDTTILGRLLTKIFFSSLLLIFKFLLLR